MARQIQPRDLCIAVATDDGLTSMVRRRNPQIVAWEVYAARHRLPKDAAMLGLTYQAWHALTTAGDLDRTAHPFDAWSETVDEVYLALADGTRPALDPDTNTLVDPRTDEDLEIDGLDPTRPDHASGP